ncbi:MAG: PRD domain-containing protein [Lachnospiraceae bacterium]
MKIIKVLNDDAVCALDDVGNERVLVGIGLGKKAKSGGKITTSQIQDELLLKSKSIMSKVQETLEKAPSMYVGICKDIMRVAKMELDQELSESIYVPLLDYMYYAQHHAHKKTMYRNTLVWEVKRFYPAEYRVARYGADLMLEKLGVTLSDEEVTSLALHIIDAKPDSNVEDTLRIMEFINKVLQIVRIEYGVAFDETSFHFLRFITHLKYFAYRIFHNSLLQEQDRELVSIIKSTYFREYQCCQKIGAMLAREYGEAVADNELIYLAIHIKRVTMEDVE